MVEARIRAAEAAGELRGLKGEGAPLGPDVADGLSGDDRFAVLLGRTGDTVPEEVVLMREIALLRERIAAPQPGDDVDALKRRVAERSLQLSILHEQAGRMLSARRTFGEE
jgi:hypothetical protein